MKKSAFLLLAGGAVALRPLIPLRLLGLRTAAVPQLVENHTGTATRVGSVAAGSYSGLTQFLNCAAISSIVFAPAGLPLAIGIQHALVGFVATQLVVTRLTGVNALLAVPSFECLPFLAQFAVIVGRAVGPDAPGALATVLAGSALVNVAAAAALVLAAEMPVDAMEKLLPPALQSGLFGAIGFALYQLSFDTLGLELGPSTLLTSEAAALWVPANLFGLGLWKASRTPALSSPALFPGFIAGVTALVHAVRLATGTSLDGARAAGWLMANAPGEPCTALWRALSPGLVRWDVLVSAAALKPLLCAALFGPILNTVLNLALLGPMVGQRLEMRRELRAHAAGTAAAAATGGYSSYVALSDTAVHRSVRHFANPTTYS